MARDKGVRKVTARRVAANAALVLTPQDRYVILDDSSDANTKTATFSGLTPADPSGGEDLEIVLLARSSTGNYRVPCNRGGTAGHVTFDAAGEGATFVRINGVLHSVTLTGATFA